MRFEVIARSNAGGLDPQHPLVEGIRAPRLGMDGGTPFTQEGPALSGRPFSQNVGGDLLSRDPSVQVPSALAGLTSVFGMGTGCSPPLSPPDKPVADKLIHTHSSHLEHSIASTSFRIQIQALGLLVPVSSMHYCTSTSGLSTWCSDQGSYPVNPVGDLILEAASRLDAFSAYPFRT